MKGWMEVQVSGGVECGAACTPPSASSLAAGGSVPINLAGLQSRGSGSLPPPPGPAPARATPPFPAAPPRRPLPAAPPRAGPAPAPPPALQRRRREARRSARGIGARAEPEPSRGRGTASGDPRWPGPWDRDGRGDRDHLARRRYRAAEPGERTGPGRSRVELGGRGSDSEAGGGRPHMGRPRMGAPGGDSGRDRGRCKSRCLLSSELANGGGGGGGVLEAGVWGRRRPEAAAAAARLSAAADFPGSGVSPGNRGEGHAFGVSSARATPC